MNDALSEVFRCLKNLVHEFQRNKTIPNLEASISSLNDSMQSIVFPTQEHPSNDAVSLSLEIVEEVFYLDKNLYLNPFHLKFTLFLKIVSKALDIAERADTTDQTARSGFSQQIFILKVNHEGTSFFSKDSDISRRLDALELKFGEYTDAPRVRGSKSQLANSVPGRIFYK